MKKLLTIMMALVMIVTLSQCKKQNEENEDNTAKVRISCTIPPNNDGKTDFTNILNGEVNWSAETEKIYLALPYAEDNHQIVELTSVAHEGTPSTLTFEGSVEKDLLKQGKHEIWYMGRSSMLTEGKVTGSIAEQSGSKDKLGYHHIAKASVYINIYNGITLTFDGNFKNQMAIAHLDLTNVAELSGEAIVGTDYSLEYSEGAYRLIVGGYNSINITGKENKNESYVVLFPTDKNAKDVELNSDSNKKITFHNGIKQNTLYKENDNQPLIWELPEHECVDLGLPSGVKWATCNIGAGSPEEYGNYYAWGEIKEPSSIDGYEDETCRTYNKQMSDISGHEIYDAAAANWGEDWRIPTKAEYEELMNEENCTWEWTSNNDFAGYKVTSKTNGNYILLPAAGYMSGISIATQVGVYGTYSCSTPTERDEVAEKSYNFSFNYNTKAIVRIYRENGRPVRPVTGGNFEKPAAQYAEVTTAEVSEITEHTAVCGGNVTVDKYSQVKERGVCWSTTQEPTIDDINDNKKAAENAVEGEYTVTLTRLAPETVYYVRAYATTDAGTSYGIEVSFNTPKIGNNNYEYNFSNMGSHAVDLGLPSGVLWSDCNIGAEWAVEQDVWPNNIYGNYFMWACINSSTSFGKEYYPEYAKECDFNYSGNATYDAATNLWGGKWRTPTRADFEELMEYCNWEVVTKDDITCMKFTSVRNGKSIYFPFAGCYNYAGKFIDLGEEGWYLISDKASSIYDDDDAPFKNLTSENNINGLIWKVYIGSSVRPVIGPIPAED